MPQSKPYDVDLAYVHDTGYGDFARNSAVALLNWIAECRNSSREVVDLGCGSGIWARALTDAKYQVVGIDVSEAMIQLAHERVPQADFRAGSFVDFQFPICRAVTAMGEVFNYLFDPLNSEQTLRQVCERIFNALVPGGMLIFDVAEPGRCAGLRQSFREGPDWTCLVEFQHDVPQQQLTRRIVTFRKVGDTYRRHEETHRQQLYERESVAGMLQGIGFDVEIVPGYGACAFAPSVVGFVARKAVS